MSAPTEVVVDIAGDSATTAADPTVSAAAAAATGAGAAAAAGAGADETEASAASTEAPAKDIDHVPAVPMRTPLKTTNVTRDAALAVSVDHRCVFPGPVQPEDSKARAFPNGTRQTMLLYDVRHGNHHPHYTIVPEGASLDLNVIETPHALQTAYASTVHGRVLSRLVQHEGPGRFMPDAAALPFPGAALIGCDTSTQTAFDYAKTLCEVDAEEGRTQDQLPMWYGSPEFEACGRRIVSMVRTAVTEVMRDAPEAPQGALVLSRPIGSNVAPGGMPNRFAWVNGVLEAVAAAEAAGAGRISIVHVDAYPPAATLTAVADKETVQLVSLFHNSVMGKDREAIPALPPAHGRTFMVPLSGAVSSSGAEALLQAAVVPMVRAFDPDLVLFVVGDATGVFTPNTDILFDLNGRVLAETLQDLLRIQPRAVVLTEAFMRPTRAGMIVTALLAVLQGRSVKTTNVFAKPMRGTQSSVYHFYKLWTENVTVPAMRDAFVKPAFKPAVPDVSDPAMVQRAHAAAAAMAASKVQPPLPSAVPPAVPEEDGAAAGGVAESKA